MTQLGQGVKAALAPLIGVLQLVANHVGNPICLEPIFGIERAGRKAPAFGQREAIAQPRQIGKRQRRIDDLVSGTATA